jgi:hypothetical protein
MNEVIKLLGNRLALEEDRLTWLIEWILSRNIEEVTSVLGDSIEEIMETIDVNISAEVFPEEDMDDFDDDVLFNEDITDEGIAAARGTMTDAAGERQLRELVEERTELCKTVAFFASVIKSGESWSDTCQTMYNNTIIHLPSRK